MIIDKDGNEYKPETRQLDKSNFYNENFVLSNGEVLSLIYWARRYCDLRNTFSSTQFNKIYCRLSKAYQDFYEEEYFEKTWKKNKTEIVILKYDKFDPCLASGGKFWPFCQDGMYDSENCKWSSMKYCEGRAWPISHKNVFNDRVQNH